MAQLNPLTLAPPGAQVSKLELTTASLPEMSFAAPTKSGPTWTHTALCRQDSVNTCKKKTVTLTSMPGLSFKVRPTSPETLPGAPACVTMTSGKRSGVRKMTSSGATVHSLTTAGSASELSTCSAKIEMGERSSYQ